MLIQIREKKTIFDMTWLMSSINNLAEEKLEIGEISETRSCLLISQSMTPLAITIAVAMSCKWLFIMIKTTNSLLTFPPPAIEVWSVTYCKQVHLSFATRGLGSGIIRVIIRPCPDRRRLPESNHFISGEENYLCNRHLFELFIGLFLYFIRGIKIFY